MEQAHNPAMRQRCFGLAKSDCRLSRLVSDGERVERGPFDQLFGRFDEIRRQLHRTLEASSKGLAIDRLAQRRPCCRDPDSAAGKPALEIGHDRSIRADHETDQVGNRCDRAGYGAESLAPRWNFPGAVVESVMLRPVLHARSRPSRQAWTSLVSAGASSAAGGGARSSSLIQPA